ncbi:MAG: helix-turn-helix domain-containing protein [Clostridia bacterium]|nr:helix-turn-helix domain-containing protein [Clostridia bacterium]
MVFQREDDASPGRLAAQLRELAPLEERDLLAEDGAGRVLMIKEGTDPGEIAEFASALVGTLESEAGIRTRAGVSDVHGGPEEWPAGYREALAALETGERLHRLSPVQIYGRQTLERIAESLDPALRAQLVKRFLKDSPEAVLTAETRETAERFFEADLNLSVAARQMFIHRNTLTYRLDRIQRETGLDLRKFEDAAVFRLLLMM